MSDEMGLVERLGDYAGRFRAANGEHTSGTLLAGEAAAEIERLEHECQASMATIAAERARAEAAEARAERLVAERDEARRDTKIEHALFLVEAEKHSEWLENYMRLKALADKLQVALRPFAAVGDASMETSNSDAQIVCSPWDHRLTNGHFRRARQALSPSPDDTGGRK